MVANSLDKGSLKCGHRHHQRTVSEYNTTEFWQPAHMQQDMVKGYGQAI